MKNVIVTGANGQLGLSIKDISQSILGFNFIFLSHKDLNVSSKEDVEAYFEINKIAFCINCAAFTNVDKSEEFKETSKEVNADAPHYLALACKAKGTVLIHVSTDFVFDGEKSTPYVEDDITKPLGVYGKTKLKGELAVLNTMPNCFIIRTSWLYSEYKHNFLKTMMRLANKREKISVVYDQVGTPTYTKDLAKFIISLIVTESKQYGTYHYSNEGVASWYDFALAIFEESNANVKVLPITSECYPTLAKRPSYSVLNKKKVRETFGITIPYWRTSLKNCFEALKKDESKS